MDLSFDSSITAKVVKAVAEFNLINEGDRVAVGLSGGKDSTFLLMILKIFAEHFKKDFKLQAVHVDPGFEASTANKIENFCQDLNIDLKIIKTRIAEYITEAETKNPCSKCAHFRKGAIINYLKKNHFNKLAFGHHLDDAVETFLMSIFYSGQLKALQPKRYLSESRVDIIRPLIYLRENVIIEEIEKREIIINKSSCPYDGNTARAQVRKDFARYFTDQQFFSNLLSAMRENNNQELWPEEEDFQLLSRKMKKHWK
ncbi:tRNA(Ile)-lysidine synthetase-like protein [Halanaerobium saccharolyticum]|uniref:tRNA(Ile)-lysidine synthetase-like protein n=1 Tax=Halanaerobium saccharolyticum TaxID=43595 RepID=A0A4R7YTW7_9FIRM|nr:tRNA 2-thiocytidine biosynthesis TtcA family protein [Halanaerobium saccharolyticum]RAK06214.1 tRNA(Ile)-lysidine synthetase-like protein [Halanaerobium saccharolyticum]TDW00579.1 tRNA(Ile)-lysidine synthetase-like protein [Halanaerobium saccharolyticum]TDX52244.1 tRNA(Ile)-lysidine synthetase-like protein [Halanaerobium saccharolyticum]